MSRLRLLGLAIGLTLAMAALGWGIGQWRQRPEPDPPSPILPDRGAFLYQVHCASCHGSEGHGDGSSATTLRPPPRDFAARPWRFEPTPASIRRVTLDGIPGTGMASFRASLTGRELDQVVNHVHKLATNGPLVEHVPAEDEQLLRAANFSDLRGTVPPPLTLTTADDKSVKLADLRGKLVLVHFWGTGCVHCIKEMPALLELEKAHAGRLVVLNVCTDEDDASVAQGTLNRLVPGAVSYTDPTGLGLARFETNALPTVWLIDPAGKAIGRATGARDWQSEPMQRLIRFFLPTGAKP